MGSYCSVSIFCVNIFFMYKTVVEHFWFFLKNMGSHLFWCFSVAFPLSSLVQSSLLHVAVGFVCTFQKAVLSLTKSSIMVSLSQQSSVAPHSYNLPQAGTSTPSSLCQAVFMLPYLYFFFVRGHLDGRIFKINLFIHLFLAVLDPLVAVSEGYAPAATCGLFTVGASFVAEHRLQGTQAPVVGTHGLSSWGSWAAEDRPNSCSAQAQLLHGTWDLPRPWTEPVSPALTIGFLSIEPPGKPCAVPASGSD